MASLGFPLFISFEGIDGSGKSTQAALLAERLTEGGYYPLLVREPGGTGVSERIRDLLLDRQSLVSPRAETLLFAAARAQLVAELIRPALAEGRPVIADRFFDSTTAYQGGGRDLDDPEWMQRLHDFTTNGLRPGRTYFIDVSIEVAAARRGPSEDRMEDAKADFFESVREAYLDLVRSEPERFRLIDGSRSKDETREAIWADLSTLLERNSNREEG